MAKVLIHIGLHKTATTFFQKKVWPNVKNYLLLTRPYTQHNHAFNKLQYADDTLYRKEELFEQINSIAAENIIISDESFSGKPVFFSYINRSIIARRLQEVFPEAKILLFIRDQKDILLSHYSSYIKNPYGIKTIDKFFWKSENDYTYKDYEKNPDLYNMKTLYYNTNDYFIHLDCFLYSKLINLYLNLFKNVEIILFEEFIENKKQVLKRIEDTLSEKILLTDADLDQKVNKKLSIVELERKRIINQTKMLKSHGAFFLKKFSTLLNKKKNKNASEIDMREYIEKYVGNYYSRDNCEVKKLLIDKAWSKYEGKYT